jgi:hypothetical protein
MPRPIRRTGINLPAADRECVLRAFSVRVANGVPLGDSRQDGFGGEVLTQAEIAQKCHVGVSTVNKMAVDFDNRVESGLDPMTI